jgi:hypothetical protein
MKKLEEWTKSSKIIISSSKRKLCLKSKSAQNFNNGECCSLLKISRMSDSTRSLMEQIQTKSIWKSKSLISLANSCFMIRRTPLKSDHLHTKWTKLSMRRKTTRRKTMTIWQRNPIILLELTLRKLLSSFINSEFIISSQRWKLIWQTSWRRLRLRWELLQATGGDLCVRLAASHWAILSLVGPQRDLIKL